MYNIYVFYVHRVSFQKLDVSMVRAYGRWNCESPQLHRIRHCASNCTLGPLQGNDGSQQSEILKSPLLCTSYRKSPHLHTVFAVHVAVVYLQRNHDILKLMMLPFNHASLFSYILIRLVINNY
jgi:hypothetical protein